VNRIDARSQVVEQVAGDAAALGLGRGTEIPLEETYCSRMLAGELPNVVPDASTEPAVRGLRATEKLGSYVGVAVTLADGTVHGSLCCASSRPRDDLGEAEVAFMRILAGMVAARIDRSRARGRP
jgi:GAF domain-containing protein